ncbi:coiled-coil domain-containing protein 146 [Hoplias malabaricus]|uniref:coiled-coil domain-containing protein 146 n=1 Tax=Hoplias malabaricus TaxID=27720 RepID=UPI003463301D
MSQAEGSSASAPGGDEEQGVCETEEPICALAPEADLQEERPSHISASPALQCLEELFSMGKISGAKVARLKASFNLLHGILRGSQESELHLLQEAKRFRAELEHQQQELEKAEQFPEGQDTEVSRMRHQLLQFYNKIRQAEDREYQMLYQLECLREEKICLEKDYESQPKPVEQEKLYLAMKESCEEIKKEIAQRRQEIRSLTEDLEVRNKQVQREQRELEERKETIESNEAELAQLLSMPGQLGKEIERISRKKMDVEQRKSVLEEQLQELAELKKQTQAQCRQLEEERRTVVRELEGGRVHLEAAQRENNILIKELEMTKEKEAILLEQRGLMDINMNHTMVEKNSLHEKLARKMREKDRLLRSLKKMQLQLKVAEDALSHTQELYDQIKSQRDVMPKGNDLQKKIKDLQKEIDHLKLSLAQQQSVVDHEDNVVELCVEREQALIRESNHCHEDLHHLNTLTLIKADERNQKSRELLKAQVRCNRIQQDIRGKQLQIQEHKKQLQDIQSRLTVFGKLYNIIKGERNNCVNLIQIATQRTADMTEKFKILEIEIEILRTNAINKDRLQQKSHLKHVHSFAIRDSLRNDISKVAWMLQEMRHKREEQRLNISKLTHMVNNQEKELLQMCKNHEASVKSRNERGVQLLEREEEICIFYERVNVQEAVIRKGTLEIQALEEEIRSLKMLITEERRQIDVCKKQLPCKRTLAEESTLLQIQLSECKDRMLFLEKALEDQATEKRSRKLSGEDPSPVELIKKIEELEVRIAEREAQLLEKELVYEQVTRLSQHICTKAETGKEDTLNLAKKVNEYQSRIKDCTKKLMAVVSELSMRQAQALCLQQELCDKELQLDACHRRLEQGLPPSDSIEQEWQRCLKEQHRHQADSEEKARIAEEDEWKQLPNGVFTTAEARPNAYIPDEDFLPLPKPYGALAPFKPSEPGTSMRHIRKPQPKPIEL